MSIENYIFSKEKKPFFLIAGPCALESENHTMRMAESLSKIAADLGIYYIFKVSWDKANRSSDKSYRGIGMEEGLKVIEKVKSEFGLPVLTDIHEPYQANPVADVADIIQIPAFLCRQTDLVIAAAQTGKPVNIKKGQFVSPYEVKSIASKVESTGNNKILITERGYSFGYHNLVVDFRAIPLMRELGYPLVFDATHSIQLPSASNPSNLEYRKLAYDLARAAVGVGIDGLFFEVHDNPSNALSDSKNMVRLKGFKDNLNHLLKI